MECAKLGWHSSYKDSVLIPVTSGCAMVAATAVWVAATLHRTASISFAVPKYRSTELPDSRSSD
jgi:hypothetical protein